MLRYRLLQFTFLLILLAILVGYFTNQVSLWFIVPLALTYLGLVVWSSFDLRLQTFIPVVFKGKETGNHLALTFDDGPTEFTSQILELLQKHNVKATFFLIGKQIEKYPEIAQNILKNGHTVGNHTYSHTNKMGFLSKNEVLAEITQNQNTIKKHLKVTPKWFRPPFGVTNPSISKAIKTSNLACIGWSIRSLDTISKSPDEIVKRVMRKLKPNGIILLHDTSSNSVIALEQLLVEIKKQQFTIVPLQELIHESAYQNEKNTSTN